jgi:hypothetical protein
MRSLRNVRACPGECAQRDDTTGQNSNDDPFCPWVPSGDSERKREWKRVNSVPLKRIEILSTQRRSKDDCGEDSIRNWPPPKRKDKQYHEGNGEWDVKTIAETLGTKHL